MTEDFLMEGKPEINDEAYAYAKMMGSKLCEYVRREFGMEFLSCVPTNIYGERDNFQSRVGRILFPH